ncbi:Transmembrane protein [Senna tora]|uniref:Transmembrane protein n=1 Tax=Senna tora TaxID=362788 RepID=A0A835CFX1_9FABA|nr:Transmembrane protein [Senna tora]
MFDLGDDLALGSSTIPWLIWIQLLVLFLLMALLYCITVFVSDPSDDPSAATTATAAADSPSTSRLLLDDVQQIEKPSAKHDSTASTLVINCSQTTQGGENRSIKGEVSGGGTSRMIVSGEEIPERDGSSLFHLCHYFQLARVAFLKCLGLDSTSDTPPTQKQRKRKES